MLALGGSCDSVSKMLKFFEYVFYVMGKALTGKTGLALFDTISVNDVNIVKID